MSSILSCPSAPLAAAPLAAVLMASLLAAAPLPARAEGPSPLPVQSQAPAGPDDRGGASEGLDLMEQGARLLFRGLLNEIRPQIEGMDIDLGQLRHLAEVLGDFSAYEMPEVLPNGDVLIRRKQPGVPERSPPERTEPDLEIGPGGEVEL